MGLSISLPQHILQVRDLVEAVRGEKIGKQPFILVGGHLAERLGPLLYDYGADGVCGSIRDCLRYMTP